MLGAYFDESYQHDPTAGHAIRMTMGGCVASADGWKRLTDQWSAVANEFNIPMFHMADFEADEGEFLGWRDERPTDRATSLNKLLVLMAEHVELYLGAFVEVSVLGEEQRRHYMQLVDSTLSSAISSYRSFNEKMAVVFARHQNLSEAKASAYTVALQRSNDLNIGPVTVADPIDCPPLQAADIFAYELSRHRGSGSNGTESSIGRHAR